jgi:hypothetical protein
MNDREFEILKIILDKGLLALLAVVVGFWLKKWQEDRIRTAERHLVPRAQLDVKCKFYGPQKGEFLVEVSMLVKNKGNTRRKFKSVRIRLRGISGGEELTFWDPQRKGRADFPLLLVKDDLLLGSTGEYYYYVEPGVDQVFTYVTKIPETVRYALCHVKFVSIAEKQEDQAENEFTEERLFEVRTG